MDTVKPDIHFVGLDQTSYFNIEADDAKYIESILGVYSYDSNSQTFCCEMTPSYWLTFHAHVAVLKDYKISEDIKDKLYTTYEGIPDEDGGMYIHCHRLEAIQAELKPFRYYHLGNPPYTRDEYDSYEEFDRALEEWIAEAYNTGSTSIGITHADNP